MRRWQKLFWISVTVLTVVSLAGALARPAIAQIRAAVVKNIDEKGRTAFQSSVPCIPDPPSQHAALYFQSFLQTSDWSLNTWMGNSSKRPISPQPQR